MRDFNKDLEHSNDNSDILNEKYTELFNCYKIEIITDLTEQKLGIDKKLYTEQGIINIEEKIRDKDHGDILLELQSCVERCTVGWTLDKSKISDYVAYYVSSTKKLYIINYKQLRQATLENLEDWTKRFQPRDAKTQIADGYYTTRNIGVSAQVLHDAGVYIQTYYLTD